MYIKKFIKRVLYTFAALILALFIFIIYLGLFTSVEMTTEELGPYTLVYNKYKGNYNKTGDIIEEVTSTLKAKYDIECEVTYGRFLDNPDNVKMEELRSESGCIIQKENIDKIKDDIEVNNFKKQRFLVAKFPYKTRLSVVLGMLKVYPVINDKIKEEKLSVPFLMEIYDTKNDQILYLIPL